MLLEGGSGIDPVTVVVVVLIIALVVLRFVSLLKGNGMRARCPRCRTVFDMPFVRGPHIGPWRYGRCPSCDKGGFMRTGVKAQLTWPPEAEEQSKASDAATDEDELDRRIKDSKYE